MARPSALTAFAVGAGVGLLVAACGAENLEAPAAVATGDIQHCRSFEQLMPNFTRALDTGKTANLKVVIENHLLTPIPPDDVPPVNEVLRAVFMTLSKLALKPAEPGATGGQYCAPSASPPPLAQANELCEVRRSLEILVHQGKGLAAVKLLQPVLVGLFDYLTGQGTDDQTHYEVASVLLGHVRAGRELPDVQRARSHHRLLGLLPHARGQDDVRRSLHAGDEALHPGAHGRLVEPQRERLRGHRPGAGAGGAGCRSGGAAERLRSALAARHAQGGPQADGGGPQAAARATPR